jgi:amidohydrolase
LLKSDWESHAERLVSQLAEPMWAVRRHLHQTPEPSGQEHQTTSYLTQQLQSLGLEPQPLASGRGLWVDVGPPGVLPRIGVRADIDALWIADEKQVPYRSQVPGVMHACGHDAHSATVLGVVMALKQLIDEQLLPWPVACRALFQPAEETNLGALEMVAAGAVEGLTHLFGLHMDPSRPAGAVGLRYGDFTADCHDMEIQIQGRGAHAARPHEAVDPIAIAAQLISSIYLFVPRGRDSHDPVVITVGQIQGGHASNVIPDQVVFRGTLRTLDSAISQTTMRHIERLARGLADASEAKISVSWRSGPPPVKNDPQLVQLLWDCSVQMLGEGQVQRIVRPSMGGEDFANYLSVVHGAMFRVGCAPGSGTAPPLHSPLFDIDRQALTVGAKVLLQAVIRWCQANPPSDFRHVPQIGSPTDATDGVSPL